MSNSLIVTALSRAQIQGSLLSQQISIDGWANEQQARGEKVQLCRDYADGDHRANLTQEMRDLLRVGTSAESSSPFNLNRMDNVIQMVADRLEVKRVEDTGDAANDWVLEVMTANDFDALQLEVHDSALTDGDTYLLVDWDNDEKQVRFTCEPAYDGTSGMLVLYQRRSRSEIVAALKIWHITSAGGSLADTMRVNVYYEDRIEKFISDNDQLKPFVDDSTDENGVAPWKGRDGQPLGVPVVHFANRAKAYDNYGRSEIDDAIPVQDALNRLMYSMVASAELAGIPVRKAINFEPPAGLAPGSWIVIQGSTPDNPADAGMMEQGDITPFLNGMAFCIQQIDQITRTPNPETMGSSVSSGEALKQREIGLLGKVKRCHVSFGNAWERAFEIAHAVATAFSTQRPPEYENFETEWREAEIRNTKELTENILAISDKIGDDMTIRMLANVYGWTEDEIQDILDQKQASMDRNIAALGAQIPRFNNFNQPQVRMPMTAQQAQQVMNGNNQLQGVA